MKTIMILFSGVGSNMEYILRHMHDKELKVVAALTNNPDAGGIEIAKRYGVPVEILEHGRFANREDYDTTLLQKVKKYNPDLVVLAGFMRILTPVFTDSVKAINLHPSFLPRHKGLNAIENSYNDPFDYGGITVHKVDSELDGGEIVLQVTVEKRGHDLKSYFQEIRKREKPLLAEAIRKVLDISQDSCDIKPLNSSKEAK